VGSAEPALKLVGLSLELAGTLETGALLGTSDFELAAGTCGFELAAVIFEVVSVGISGVEQQSVA